MNKVLLILPVGRGASFWSLRRLLYEPQYASALFCMFERPQTRDMHKMRSLWVLGLLTLTMVSGAYIYTRKPPSSDSRFIDMITRSMRGIDKAIPVGSRIGVQRFVNFSLVYPINHYALASQYISLFEGGHFDTLLVLTPSSASDSVLNAAIGGRRVLWQNQDSMYRYYITCSL